MRNITGYKHIIWDWNGTLLNDVELCCGIMNNLLTSRGMPPITVDYYRTIFTFPVKEYYKKAGHDVSDENWEILSHEFIDQYEAGKYSCSLYKSAESLLERIKNLGIDQSVLSAYSQHTLEEMIEYFGLKKYFMKLVGLDNIYAAGKIENGRKWMSMLGLQKGEVLLIGDTVHDFEVAEEIGADSLLISTGHQNREILEKCGVEVADSIEALLH